MDLRFASGTSQKDPEEGLPSPLGISLVKSTIVVDKRLEITFRRTIRVPDNDKTSHLPPDLGQMTLTNVNQVADKLPDEMAAKGGLLLAMSDNEAMWINFNIKGDPDYVSSRRHYAIKIYAGGVNVISGEPENENTATTLRRRNLLNKGESVQDYVVVPGQRWIDGIASGKGKVQQFVAKTLGGGFTVEGQVTGAEDVGGLQFEIISTKRHPRSPSTSGGSGRIYVRLTTGKTIPLHVAFDWTVDVLMELIEDEEDIPQDKQRLVAVGRLMAQGEPLRRYNITRYSTVFLFTPLRELSDPPSPENEIMSMEIERLRFEKEMESREAEYQLEIQRLREEGGRRIHEVRMQQELLVSSSVRPAKRPTTCASPIHELRGAGVVDRERTRERSSRSSMVPAAVEPQLGIAAGGKIHQAITKDPKRKEEWDTQNILAFNVQILNSKLYTQVTGLQAPSEPQTAKNYATGGGYFYEMPEAASDVYGDFSLVKSIGQLTGQLDQQLQIVTKTIGNKKTYPSSDSEVSELDAYGYADNKDDTEIGKGKMGKKPSTSKSQRKPMEAYLRQNPESARSENILCQDTGGRSFRTVDEVVASLRRRQFASFD